MGSEKNNTRISGIQTSYKYRKWLGSQLNQTPPNIDYFSFAKTFSGSEKATNEHYSDLIQKLQKKQTNKVTRAAQKAYSLFAQRKRKPYSDFLQKYKSYWKERENCDTRKALEIENNRTIARLNRITNERIRKQAEEIYSDEESYETEEEQESQENDEEESSEDGNGLNDILKQSKEMASDEVGCIGILDLSSSSVLSVLKNETTAKKFNELITAATIPPINLTEYAKDIIDSIQTSHMTTSDIRLKLYESGHQKTLNSIVHHDASFIEVTVRHFIDLMDSPNSPLLQNTLERTAAVYTSITIINQLFLANNDIIELAWLEREYFLTDRTKWDGILFKSGNNRISTGLIEFSGGVHDNSPSAKEQSDIKKLYSKMLEVIDNTTTTPVQKTMFSMRFYGNTIYFEKLTEHNGSMLRTVTTSFIIPTTPRLLKEYVTKIPEIIAWKESVVNHTLELQR